MTQYVGNGRRTIQFQLDESHDIVFGSCLFGSLCREPSKVGRSQSTSEIVLNAKALGRLTFGDMDEGACRRKDMK